MSSKIEPAAGKPKSQLSGFIVILVVLTVVVGLINAGWLPYIWAGLFLAFLKLKSQGKL